MDRDVELGSVKPEYLNGFPYLSNFIATDEDNSTSIYHRFDRLGARNILYLQSELTDLEARQRKFDEEDGKGSRDDKLCAWDWAEFKRLSSSQGRQKDRMQLVVDIRKTIKEYSKSPVISS